MTAPLPKTSKPHLEATEGMISRGKKKKGKACLRIRSRTEDLISDIVLPNEFAEKLLVYTGLVDDLAVYC